MTLFKGLEQYEKLKLIDGLQIATYTKDQFVFHEGDTGDKFYIIESGTCDCLKVDSQAEGGFQNVRELGESDHFGEIAILKNVKRTLSIRTSSDSMKLLVLTREAFSRILGSIKDYLKEDYKRENNLDSSFESSDNENDKNPKIALRPALLPVINEDDD